jgi:hypothetical protein
MQLRTLACIFRIKQIKYAEMQQEMTRLLGRVHVLPVWVTYHKNLDWRHDDDVV